MHEHPNMTITMGQLVSEVFEAYERRYGDAELAAVATEVTVDDIMRFAGKRRSSAARAASRRRSQLQS